MAIVHSYTMTARDGKEADLLSALEDLAAAARAIAGSQGAMVLQDRKEPQTFLLIEMWDNEESRGAAGKQLPKDVMGRVMAAQGGPIRMALWDRRAG